MRELEFYARECKNSLDALKIKYDKNAQFKINTRAVTRLGLCRRQGKQYVIEISAALLDERVDVQILKDTILHELLHTCYGCMKHTGRWKALAEKVNAAYGCNVTRAADENVIPSDMQPEPKYIVKCNACGVEIKRQKRSALVKNPGRYRCGKCGGKLTVINKKES